MQFLPRTGPLRLDCRTLGAAAAVLRVRLLVSKVRRGARRLDVQVDTPSAVDAISRWARRHGAPHAVAPSGDGWMLVVYLMPEEFGAPPRPSLREGARPFAHRLVQSAPAPELAPATVAA